MAEGSYVKLTEDQIALQNITPGELNEPIDIEKVIHVFKKLKSWSVYTYSIDAQFECK